MDYVDQIQGDRTTPLSDNERKRCFFGTFPKTCQTDYVKSGNKFHTDDVENIKDFMRQQKRVSDKEHAKSENKKESKKKKKVNEK